jgi:hypothetical protein
MKEIEIDTLCKIGGGRGLMEIRVPLLPLVVLELGPP